MSQDRSSKQQQQQPQSARAHNETMPYPAFVTGGLDYLGFSCNVAHSKSSDGVTPVAIRRVNRDGTLGAAIDSRGHDGASETGVAGSATAGGVGEIQMHQVSRVGERSLARTSGANAATEIAVQPESSNGGGGGNELLALHRLMRGRYVAALVLALIGAAAGGFLGFKAGGRTYQSVAQIRVRPFLPKILYSVEDKGMLPMFDQFVDAQVSLISSQRILERATDSPEWRALGRPLSQDTLAQLIKNLEVVRDGEMVYVKVCDPDQNAAQVTTKCIVNAYERIFLEQDEKDSATRLDKLNEMQTRLSNELGATKQRIRKIANESGSEDLKSLYDAKLSDLNQLASEVQDAQLSLAGVADEKKDPKAPPREPTVDEIAASDATLKRLVDEKAEWDRKIDILSNAQHVGPYHKDLVAAQSMSTSLAAQIGDRVKKLRAERPAGGVGTDIAAYSHSVDALRARLAALREIQEKQHAELLALGRKDLEIKDLHDDEKSTTKRLDDVEKRIEELRTESVVSGRVSIISPGDPPLGVHKDTKLTFGAVGGLGGGALGAGLIVLLALVDRRLRSPEDPIASGDTVPMLGILPSLPDDLSDPGQAAQAAHCVHEIRSHLQIKARQVGDHVLAVTSPASGTGKTTLTLALGVSFASAGSKTLLVDCDMVGGGLTHRVDAILRRRIGQVLRREGLISGPQLNEALRLANGSRRRLGEVLVELGYLTEDDLARAIAVQDEARVGMLDALDGEPLETCVASTGVDGLFILPLGGATARHVGGLSPLGLRRVLDAARAQFDVVLIDTGPIPGSLEASMVASQAAGVILTVSRGESRSSVERSVAHLAAIGARMSGAVFNRARERDMFGSSRRISSSSPAKSNGSRSAAGPEQLMADDPVAARMGPVARAVAAYRPDRRNSST